MQGSSFCFTEHISTNTTFFQPVDGSGPARRWIRGLTVFPHRFPKHACRVWGNTTQRWVVSAGNQPVSRHIRPQTGASWSNPSLSEFPAFAPLWRRVMGDNQSGSFGRCSQGCRRVADSWSHHLQIGLSGHDISNRFDAIHPCINVLFRSLPIPTPSPWQARPRRRWTSRHSRSRGYIPHFAAEVEGVNFSQPIPDDVFEEILAASAKVGRQACHVQYFIAATGLIVGPVWGDGLSEHRPRRHRPRRVLEAFRRPGQYQTLYDQRQKATLPLLRALRRRQH